jgi:hypothetical protein
MASGKNLGMPAYAKETSSRDAAAANGSIRTHGLIAKFASRLIRRSCKAIKKGRIKRDEGKAL